MHLKGVPWLKIAILASPYDRAKRTKFTGAQGAVIEIARTRTMPIARAYVRCEFAAFVLSAVVKMNIAKVEIGAWRCRHEQSSVQSIGLSEVTGRLWAETFDRPTATNVFMNKCLF